MSNTRLLSQLASVDPALVLAVFLSAQERHLREVIQVRLDPKRPGEEA